ncbi:AAA family ATPase [soil metagenome]
MTLVLVDGRSGSGKTTFAATLGLPVLHMDDLYPGWHGLAAGSEYLLEALRTRRYRRWDWAVDDRAEWHDLPDDLVVEGVGCLTRGTSSLADRAVWLELAEPLRRQRALARDPSFAKHWDAWAAQEEAFIARENPRALATELR